MATDSLNMSLSCISSLLILIHTNIYLPHGELASGEQYDLTHPPKKVDVLQCAILQVWNWWWAC